VHKHSKSGIAQCSRGVSEVQILLLYRQYYPIHAEFFAPASTGAFVLGDLTFVEPGAIFPAQTSSMAPPAIEPPLFDPVTGSLL
jgi:hypothetical protein